MTDPQRAENDEVLVNPSTGMPETRQERDQREQQERQKSTTQSDHTTKSNES